LKDKESKKKINVIF